jgi:hypothetical protein
MRQHLVFTHGIEEEDYGEYTPLQNQGRKRRLNLCCIIPQLLCVVLCCGVMASLAPGGSLMIYFSKYLKDKEYAHDYVPVGNGHYGYKNPMAISITSQTTCHVVQPLVKCHMVHRPFQTTECHAQIRYKDHASVEHTLITNTTFLGTSRYSKYGQGSTVACFYDKYRWDMVSYYSYMNIESNKSYYTLLKVLGIIFVVIGSLCVLCSCCAFEEVIRRNYFNREYQSKVEVL